MNISTFRQAGKTQYSALIHNKVLTGELDQEELTRIAKMISYDECTEIHCRNCGYEEYYFYHPYSSTKISCVECDGELSTIGAKDVK